MKNNSVSRIYELLGRVILSVILLFTAYIVGGLLGLAFDPHSPSVTGMETYSLKIGSSISIVFISFLIGRYICKSFKMALACLGVTELVVLLIIIFVYGGPGALKSDNTRANVLWWLWELTWNVVVAFLVGTVFARLISYRLNKQMEKQNS